MLCESCNEQEATVHLTQVVDGSVKKVHMCEACAAKSGFDIQGPISISDILLGMGSSAEETKESSARSCPRCHLRRADFKKTGRLGCPECYQTFANELAPLIKAMHRSEQHVGKVPAREGMMVKMSAEIAQLQQDLDQAVSQENYEKAATLRDKIQACKTAAAEDDKKKRKAKKKS